MAVAAKMSTNKSVNWERHQQEQLTGPSRLPRGRYGLVER